MKISNNSLFRFFGIILIFVFLLSLLGFNEQIAEANNNLDQMDITKSEVTQQNISDDVPNQPQDLSDTKAVVEVAAWRNLRPTESYLRDVSLLPESIGVDCASPDQMSKGWIVGDDGLILGYCNGVWDHALKPESVPTLLHGVKAITPTLAIAVGAEGTILKYGWDTVAEDYVWIKLPIVLGEQRLNRIVVIPESDGNYSAWVTGSKDSILNKGTLIKGTISKTGSLDPYGHPIYTSFWDNVTDDYPSLPNTDYYFGLSMLNKNDIWAVGGNSANSTGGAIHWNGSTWTYYEVGNHVLYGVHFLAPNDGWAAGAGGYIYHFDGTNWSLHSQPSDKLIVDISFDVNGIGWAVGFEGSILKFDPFRASWSVFEDLRTDYFDFYSIDHTSGHGWLVGMNFKKGIGGQILEYSEDLWLAITPPTDNLLHEISVLSDNNAWAVGTADEYGTTIIHWDGKHWQRWYQKDSPLPKVNLYTIDMISENNGWAAGDPTAYYHWDGYRWAPTRYLSPISVRTNDMDLETLDPLTNPHDFGWAVANNGNAVAKYDYNAGYWSANYTYQAVYYNLRGTDTNSDEGSNWDAWAVGRQASGNEYFMRFMEVPSGGNAWAPYASPEATACGATDGATNTNLFGIEMFNFEPTLDGFAVGDYRGRAVMHRFIEDEWVNVRCQVTGTTNPSRFYSVDVNENTGTAWVGGYYTKGSKVAYLGVYDELGFHWAGDPYPKGGVRVNHRPISSVGFSSDTMGWAVGGDKEDSSKISVIYQYPFPNYSLEINPQIVAIQPGEQVDLLVSARSSGDLDASIGLVVVDLDPAINSTLSLNTIDINQSSTLTLSTTTETPIGEYFGWIKGSFIFMSGETPITLTRYEYFELIVTDHPIYNVEPDHGPAGTTVTISGVNFGSDPGIGNRSTAENHVILAGKQMPDSSIQTWTDNTITLIVPDDVSIFEFGPEEGPVSVTVNGSPSNQNLSFQLENFISDVSVKDTATGYEITIDGTSFGKDPGYLNRSTTFENVILNGVQLDTGSVTYWDNNNIVFNTPTINLQNSLVVTSNGFQSNQYLFGESFDNIFLPLIIK